MAKTRTATPPAAKQPDAAELLAQVTAENEALLEMNDELQTKLETASKNIEQLQLPVVKLGKDSYDIKVQAFIFNGKKYTSADVQADPELASALVEIGSKILIKQNN